MDLAFLARGLAVGFTVAAAVGPISVLTIRRTIAHGRIYGLVSGIGVALADASYAGIAAFGLTAITSVLVGARVALGLPGLPAEGASLTDVPADLNQTFSSVRQAAARSSVRQSRTLGSARGRSVAWRN